MPSSGGKKGLADKGHGSQSVRIVKEKVDDHVGDFYR
jgi:hypothetical protein